MGIPSSTCDARCRCGDGGADGILVFDEGIGFVQACFLGVSEFSKPGKCLLDITDFLVNREFFGVVYGICMSQVGMAGHTIPINRVAFNHILEGWDPLVFRCGIVFGCVVDFLFAQCVMFFLYLWCIRNSVS